jgi:predicted MFS family arabinose efflux permease
VGGYLLFAHGFRLTYLVLGVISIVAFALAYGFLRSDPGASDDSSSNLDTIWGLLDRPKIRALLSFRVLFSMGKMIVLIFLPIYGRTVFGLSAFAIGGILAGGKLTKSLTQGRVGRLTDRAGRREPFIVAGALVYALAALTITLAAPAEGLFEPVVAGIGGRTVALTPPLLVLFVAFAFAGVGDSLRLPASMALFVEEGEQFDAAASSLSLRSVVWKLGLLIGPVTAGALNDRFSAVAGFVLAAGTMLAATGVYLGHRYRHGATVVAAVGRSDG